jgi:phospho-N-acetylmuramoyl-pentapeptide-transferase
VIASALPNALTGVRDAFWGTLAVAALIAYPVLVFLRTTNSRQVVSEYAPSTHRAKQGTPTMGGIIVVVALLVVFCFAPIEPLRVPILAIVSGFAFIGLLDDAVVPRCLPGKRGLGWKEKLVLQFLVACGALWTSGQAWSWIAVGAVVVVGYSNAYNFTDGLDGLAATIAMLFSLGIVVLAISAGDASNAIVSAALVGGLTPFLLLNAPPARVFMGDVGSLPIGALLGYQCWSLALGSDSTGVAQWDWRPDVALALAVMSLLLAAELVPVPLQIAWVKLFKKRLFRMTPIHHGFEDAGWPESRVVWTFAIAQGLLVVAGLSLSHAMGGGA